MPEEDQVVEEDISLDMSKAKTFTPLPINIPFLVSLSKWVPGRTEKGRKMDYELTVIKPEEYANRKLPESVSLENEYTLGRYQTMLLALGFPEEEVKSKKHKVPKSNDILGMQCTVYTRVRKSDAYGDRSVVSRFLPAANYDAAAAQQF